MFDTGDISINTFHSVIRFQKTDGTWKVTRDVVIPDTFPYAIPLELLPLDVVNNLRKNTLTFSCAASRASTKDGTASSSEKRTIKYTTNPVCALAVLHIAITKGGTRSVLEGLESLGVFGYDFNLAVLFKARVYIHDAIVF